MLVLVEQILVKTSENWTMDSMLSLELLVECLVSGPVDIVCIVTCGHEGCITSCVCYIFEDMIRRRHLRTRSIKMLVLDEADEMLNKGFKEQIYDVYRYLPPATQVL